MRLARFLAAVTAIALGTACHRTTEPLTNRLLPPMPPGKSVLPPPSIYEVSNWVSPSSYMDAHTLRGIVVIRFHPSATNEARTAALDSISGTVIGQRALGTDEPFQYIQLPLPASDSAVFVARRVLLRQSAVMYAEPETIIVDPRAWRPPTDDSSWVSTDWRLHNSSAYTGAWQARWALEARGWDRNPSEFPL